MIAFGPDMDVPATPVQVFARRVLVVGCSVLGLGVISSVVRLSSAPPPAEALAARPLRFVADSDPRERFPTPLPAMAAARPAARSVVELVHDTPAAGSAVAPSHVVWMLVTAYCPCPKCCGKHATGLTASGKPTSSNNGRFVAAPADLPFGSKVSVPGYNHGRPVPVLDRGGAIKGTRLDVFFPTHDEARQWGRRWVAVTVAGN